jgi:hypothetical protein
MAVDINNYNPMYVADPSTRGTKYVVTAEEWSTLWQLISLQTNNTSANLKALLDKLIVELWSASGASYIQTPALTGCALLTVAGQLAWLKSYTDAHKSSIDHDHRYYTKTELATYLQGGDTSIGVEVFTIVHSNNGNGTFTYNNGTQDIIGTLTAEGHQVFTLQKGEYLMQTNRIEVIINDTLHRSVASGGLAEYSNTQVALTSPEGDGAEITIKYYIRISLTGEQSVSYSSVQPPQTADKSIMWFKLLA